MSDDDTTVPGGELAAAKFRVTLHLDSVLAELSRDDAKRLVDHLVEELRDRLTDMEWLDEEDGLDTEG